MTNRPTETGKGIFTLFFREAGLFSEQAWQWANERAQEGQKYFEERTREGQKYLEDRAREGQQFLAEQAREDRVLSAEDEKRRLSDATTRKADAEAKLLEQMRLAKQAGLDVEAILRRVREDAR